MESRLRVVPIKSVGYLKLVFGWWLAVKSNPERIEREFPGALKRYGTFWRTCLSVWRALHDPDRTKRRYAILFDKKVIGAALIWDFKIEVWGEVQAEGPEISYWLAARSARPPAGRTHLAPFILREIARIIVLEQLYGVPWTIVRVGHEHSYNCLVALDNGFGGMTPGVIGKFMEHTVDMQIMVATDWPPPGI